ncbi:MAG: IPTL-CTERM sorting domain-containing protein, partial [Chitinophagales bacterium]
LFIDEASQTVYIATRGGVSQVVDTSIIPPAVPSSIPTLSQWGLIILALSLMTFGTLHLINRESGKTA